MTNEKTVAKYFVVGVCSTPGAPRLVDGFDTREEAFNYAFAEYDGVFGEDGIYESRWQEPDLEEEKVDYDAFAKLADKCPDADRELLFEFEYERDEEEDGIVTYNVKIIRKIVRMRAISK